jgi:hypothetical protein
LGAIGTALLVLFFTIGVIKTCGSFAELKRPETAVKVFIRFAISKFLIDNCLKLMVNFVTIVQSIIAKITASSPIGTALEFSIPSTVQSKFEGIGILDGAIPIWAICFIAHIAFIVIGIASICTGMILMFPICIVLGIMIMKSVKKCEGDDTAPVNRAIAAAICIAFFSFVALFAGNTVFTKFIELLSETSDLGGY